MEEWQHRRTNGALLRGCKSDEEWGGLIKGRENLKATMQDLNTMGFVDLDFHSDEVGGFSGENIQEEGALAYQRYHEAMMHKDGSVISMIHGFMLWKRVARKWLIEMYANCAVTADATNTQKLRDSIQQAFSYQLGHSWGAKDERKAIEYFSKDCILTAPRVLKGQDEISIWLKELFGVGACHMNLMIDRVVSVAEIYVFSQLVYINCPNITIRGDSKVLKTGCGNAIVRRTKETWKVSEAMWNIHSVTLE